MAKNEKSLAGSVDAAGAGTVLLDSANDQRRTAVAAQAQAVGAGHGRVELIDRQQVGDAADRDGQAVDGGAQVSDIHHK